MNEPKRWIEERPPEAVHRLLQAAEAEQPSDGSFRRVLAGVGVGLGATGAAASAGAAGTGVVLSGGKGAIVAGAWAKWVLLSVAAVGAGTVAVRRASEAGTVTPSVAATVVPREVPLAITAPAVVAPAPVALVKEEPAAAVPPKPPVAAVPVKPAAAPAAEAPMDAERLAEEVRFVDKARSALAAGRGAETLAALDDYESRFGGRRFAPEVLYLRMQALLSLGRGVEARAAAERLVRAFPASPHTARARRVLGETIP